jgi:NADPH-dependent methylglyoxal reductase
MSRTILLTGASGFIALHIIGVLLSKGYTVIGTVRSQDKADKITSQFKEVYPEGKLYFEIVGDIAAEGAFDETLKSHPEITGVLHTASPFSYGIDKPFKDAYLIPATQGTKNVLKAIVDHAPQVKQVVITSSFAAIVNISKSGDKTFIHTEETWNPITWDDVDGEHRAYQASKKLAEELARDFVKENKVNFTLTTINPPFVFGPQRFTDSLANPTLNTSAEFVNNLLTTPVDTTEFIGTPAGLAVDVRDVATLHVLPLENEELAGKRLTPISASFNAQALLNIIHETFPELDGKIGKGDTSKDAQALANENGSQYDTSNTLKWTGFESWIPIEKTIKDSVQQILENRN